VSPEDHEAYIKRLIAWAGVTLNPPSIRDSLFQNMIIVAQRTFNVTTTSFEPELPKAAM